MKIHLIPHNIQAQSTNLDYLQNLQKSQLGWDLTLETFSKQIQTWWDILEEIPEYVKYADLVESLKTNKDIKGLPKYIGEHILPVLENKEDQTIKKVLEILTLKYGRTRVEKIEDFMDDWTKFKDDQY